MYDLPDLVEALLRKSATDTSIRSFEGLTPLHIAAGTILLIFCNNFANIILFSFPESRHENVVRILLSYGADCNLLDNYGMTASQRAIKVWL